MKRLMTAVMVLGVMAAPGLGAEEMAGDCTSMLEQVVQQAEEVAPSGEQAQALDALLMKGNEQASKGDEGGCIATVEEIKALLGSE